MEGVAEEAGGEGWEGCWVMSVAGFFCCCFCCCFDTALDGEEVAAVAGEDVALVVDLHPGEGREGADVALAGGVFDQVVDVVVVGEGDVPGEFLLGLGHA